MTRDEEREYHIEHAANIKRSCADLYAAAPSEYDGTLEEAYAEIDEELRLDLIKVSERTSDLEDWEEEACCSPSVDVDREVNITKGLGASLLFGFCITSMLVSCHKQSNKTMRLP